MQTNYNMVPDIITGKDLDYLSDMFNWNYGGLKTINESISNVQDVTLKEFLTRVYQFFNSNLTEVLNILEGGSNE